MNLPILKAYTLKGPAKFTVTPCVQINLQCTKDSLTLERALYAFMNESEIYPLFGGISGGGHHVAYYSEQDAGKIKAWLKEQGAKTK